MSGFSHQGPFSETWNSAPWRETQSWEPGFPQEAVAAELDSPPGCLALLDSAPWMFSPASGMSKLIIRSVWDLQA